MYNKVVSLYIYMCMFLLFSCWVLSDSLWPHAIQHTRLPCPPLSPGVCWNSRPLSRRCYTTILSSVALLSFCLQSFPASGSFPMGQLFPSGGWSIGASTIASVLPMTTGLISFKIDWFDLFAVQGTLKSLLQHHGLKASILWCSAFFMVWLSLYTWSLEKPYLWLYWPLLAKWCLCFLICCLGLS